MKWSNVKKATLAALRLFFFSVMLMLMTFPRRRRHEALAHHLDGL